jgi:hypothetical protein
MVEFNGPSNSRLGTSLVIQIQDLYWVLNLQFKTWLRQAAAATKLKPHISLIFKSGPWISSSRPGMSVYSPLLSAVDNQKTKYQNRLRTIGNGCRSCIIIALVALNLSISNHFSTCGSQVRCKLANYVSKFKNWAWTSQQSLQVHFNELLNYCKQMFIVQVEFNNSMESCWSSGLPRRFVFHWIGYYYLY